MGISLLGGRLFTPADAPSGISDVCIVNQALAELAWPGQDPLGKRIRVMGDRTRSCGDYANGLAWVGAA